MTDFSLEDMQNMQRELNEKYQDQWGPLAPKQVKNQFLNLFIEAGEAADVVKKQGTDAILHQPEARARFLEEMCDILMYWNDILICCGITPEEAAQAYRKKHIYNMARW